MTQSASVRLESRTAKAFVEEERQGMMLAAKVRTVALLLILTWQAIDNPDTGLTYLFDLLEVASFALIGGLQFYCAWRRIYPTMLPYIFVFLDCCLLAVILCAPSPFEHYVLPPAVMMDSTKAMYFFMFLMQAVFSLRPGLVVCCGICIAVARGGMWLWFVYQPGVFTNLDLPEQTAQAFVAARPDPNFLFLGYGATELLVVLIVAAGLAIVAERSRRLVRRRISAERTRSSLARYFSPNVADRLSQAEDPFGNSREQDVAVLFADIIGFTKLCESEGANDVINLLREYHDRFGKAVFDNHGTIDKYIGDGLMATFGTPDPSPLDPSNALHCAKDMLKALDTWNEERTSIGLATVRVGIGVHYGRVIAGDIGNDRRLEYSVIGDTVNIASRLEQLTRTLGSSLVVSNDLISALNKDDARQLSLLNGLSAAGDQMIRGRNASVAVWIISVPA